MAYNENLQKNNEILEAILNLINNMEVGGGCYASYLAFIRGATGDELDAAFGKNNEDYLTGLGEALARYAIYKNPTLNIETDFANLSKCNSFYEIVTTKAAVNELINNADLLSLCNINHFTSQLMYLNNASSILYTTEGKELDSADFTSSYFTASAADSGLSFSNNTGTSNTGNYVDIVSNNTFPTNGAKYLCFHCVSIGSSKVDKFGVSSSNCVTCAAGNTYKIDISGLSEINLYGSFKLHTGLVLVITDICLTDF